MMSDWPQFSEDWCYADAENITDHMKEVIRGVRNARVEMNVPPSRKAKVYVVCEDEKLCEGFEELTTCACPLMSASELAVQADKAGIADDAVSIVVPDASVYVPLEELMPCNSCKCKMLWLSGPKNPYILKFIVRKQRGIQLRDQVETLIIYGKQINKIVVKISDLFLKLPETWESNIYIPFLAGKKYTAFFVCKDKAVFIRGRRFVFVVISMWCDVLNHIVDILFFILL